MSVSASELTKERLSLLERLAEIDEALSLLSSPGAPVEIRTRRNLRNTWLDGVIVYADEAMTERQDSRYHEGYITAEDAAKLKSGGNVDDDYITLY